MAPLTLSICLLENSKNGKDETVRKKTQWNRKGGSLQENTNLITVPFKMLTQSRNSVLHRVCPRFKVFDIQEWNLLCSLPKSANSYVKKELLLPLILMCATKIAARQQTFLSY